MVLLDRRLQYRPDEFHFYLSLSLHLILRPVVIWIDEYLAIQNSEKNKWREPNMKKRLQEQREKYRTPSPNGQKSGWRGGGQEGSNAGSTHRITARRQHVDIVNIVDKRWVPSPLSVSHATTTQQQDGHTSDAKGKTAEFLCAWRSLVFLIVVICHPRMYSSTPSFAFAFHSEGVSFPAVTYVAGRTPKCPKCSATHNCHGVAGWPRFLCFPVSSPSRMMGASQSPVRAMP